MNGEESSSRDFRHLRNDGVAEGGNAVCPTGNPMSLSTHIGHGAPSNSIDKPICLPICFLRVIAGVLLILPRFRLSDA